MDPIKEAFSKIKQDMDFLKEEIVAIRNKLNNLQSNLETSAKQTTPTQGPMPSAQQTNIQTPPPTQSIQNIGAEGLYGQDIATSTGNEGVPTNRPTYQQTDQHPTDSYGKPPERKISSLEDFKKASEILHSLDSIKKEIRAKFKLLTSQEMLVFSTLYGLEEQNIQETTYRTLSKILCLSESSIRDYINKLLKKGVPINKIRQNNKTILLQISPDLKGVTTLEAIQKLREL
jgi:hypothetical protein